MKNKYSDIINLPHHVSESRPQMPISDRAAQFSPFAALTGYGDAIKETGRLTYDESELNSDAIDLLNIKFQLLIARLNEDPVVSFTYFKPDERKDGGDYITVTGKVKRIDDISGVIFLRNGVKIPIANISDISGDVFTAIN